LDSQELISISAHLIAKDDIAGQRYARILNEELIEIYKEREIEHLDDDDDGMKDEDERKREGEVESLAREDANLAR
jgi:hypothetical protein